MGHSDIVFLYNIERSMLTYVLNILPIMWFVYLQYFWLDGRLLSIRYFNVNNNQTPFKTTFTQYNERRPTHYEFENLEQFWGTPHEDECYGIATNPSLSNAWLPLDCNKTISSAMYVCESPLGSDVPKVSPRFARSLHECLPSYTLLSGICISVVSTYRESNLTVIPYLSNTSLHLILSARLLPFIKFVNHSTSIWINKGEKCLQSPEVFFTPRKTFGVGTICNVTSHYLTALPAFIVSNDCGPLYVQCGSIGSACILHVFAL